MIPMQQIKTNYIKAFIAKKQDIPSVSFFLSTLWLQHSSEEVL